MKKFCLKHFLSKHPTINRFWFHIIGITCLIWFLIRVVPAPHRARYPCQQMSLTIALAYIAFWSGLLITLKLGLKRIKTNLSLTPSAIAITSIILLALAGPALAINFQNMGTTTIWDPIPLEPIGTPQGANPGRVVWVWNPDATQQHLDGYWWEQQNNNQTILDTMMSHGIQNLAGESTDAEAWDILFTSFNVEHGNGEHGYQPGEKIAIKINMNNGYFEPYESVFDDVDANPYVVKALLRQLINVVGVAQEDITVYDASRKLMNWFYNRVYYQTYPADPLISEFPQVHFVDSTGGALGREQVVASTERVYFAAGSCAYRTLPTVVTEAEYMINMPITKRHVGDRVTLAGKNWFGTWMEDVYPVHDYHEIGYKDMGNPAPQTDLFAHEQLGGKTLLLIGDGTYGCRQGNSDISYFEMYPFDGDWMSSLFFSQDSVALDSVMYDFLHADNTGPSEGAQNYLHQAAQPPLNVYDPEHDGVFLSESLGVHEHWDRSIDIFSSDRYSGPENQGIDYIALGSEYAQTTVTITTPLENRVYLMGKELLFSIKVPRTLIIGRIEVKTEVFNAADGVEKVEFYVDNNLMYTAESAPFLWNWQKRSLLPHTLQVIAYPVNADPVEDSIRVWKLF